VKSPLQYRILPLGDHALCIQLGDIIDASINQQCIAIFHQLKEAALPFIKDIIPAYASLTVVYDVVGIRKEQPSAYGSMKEKLEAMLLRINMDQPISSRKIEIPVCYDLSLGVDLQEMSQEKNIPVEEIIRIHTNKTYRVFMIGFLPGFAYMGSVDESIITARRTKPRTNVAAGSVGIAGEQTGIYPLDSPGGWNIIGQTPLKLFDAKREKPVLLEAGDEIKFVAIDINEFNKYNSG